MLEVLFLLSFTLHNIEEGIWLPRWSENAGKYYVKVSNRQFHFALIVITILGYMLTFISLLFGKSFEVVKYIYLGFILMMCFNSIFPHLLLTIVLRKYAPGTLTGLLLNLPIGLVIINRSLESGMKLSLIILVSMVVTCLTVASLRPLFKLGDILIDKY